MIRRSQRPLRATPAIHHHESRCMVFTGASTSRALEDPDEISELLKDRHNFVWFDLAEPTAHDLELLKAEFALHPTAIEDAALVHERPKIEAFDGYHLVVAHAATLEGTALVLHEIAIFVGGNFVVTIRAHPVFPLDEIERRWTSRGSVPHTSAGLLYVILDVIVDAYHPVTVEYEERLVAIENQVVGPRPGGTASVLRGILGFKRDLVELRHAAAPMRDILSPVLRGELGTLDPSLNAYFRDVYDHALRTTDQIDAIRDLLNSTLDIHLSSEAHRQSEVSKQLTVIATIFLPLAYITGFFGQNFGWMVNRIGELPQFLWLGVGSQALTVIALVAYFRHKRWF
ncbi:MAG TPA: magnesium transporter CorA family protein [Candidatus Elarobacter sp.]